MQHGVVMLEFMHDSLLGNELHLMNPKQSRAEPSADGGHLRGLYHTGWRRDLGRAGKFQSKMHQS
jgi:hypothetical protein